MLHSRGTVCHPPADGLGQRTGSDRPQVSPLCGNAATPDRRAPCRRSGEASRGSPRCLSLGGWPAVSTNWELNQGRSRMDPQRRTKYRLGGPQASTGPIPRVVTSLRPIGQPTTGPVDRIQWSHRCGRCGLDEVFRRSPWSTILVLTTARPRNRLTRWRHGSFRRLCPPLPASACAWQEMSVCARNLSP